MSRNTVLVILIMVLFSGCIGTVQWKKRTGGKEREETWIAVCPYCDHVVDYKSWRCTNPDCRVLLAWQNKELYYDFPTKTSSSEEITPVKKVEPITPKETEQKPKEENPNVKDQDQDQNKGQDQDQDENPDIDADYDDVDWE